jgi:HD superfamily phosphodiesterase
MRIINSDMFREGTHGIEHLYRVLLIVRKICSLDHFPDRNKELLEFCALFHDIGRIHDEHDEFHGFRSTKKLDENEYFGLSALNVPLTRYIIENHCIHDDIAYANIRKYKVADSEEALLLIRAFKDSDNLDRVRLGDFDASYLRLPVSHQLIPYAYEIYQNHTDRKLIEDEIFSWISSRVNRC